MDALIPFSLLAGLGLILWGLIAFFRGVIRVAGNASRTSADQGDTIDGMNEGDLHSGPHGYSPTTAYPQTQYGSGFYPEADWNHEEQ